MPFPMRQKHLSAKSLTRMEWLSAGQTRLVSRRGRHCDRSIFLSLGLSDQGTPYQKMALFAIKSDAGLRPRWPSNGAEGGW